jgi:thiol-disulfide isomerase/thioredoxin
MKNKTILIFIFSLASIVSFIAISAIGVFGNTIRILAGSLIYFFGVYFTLKKVNKFNKELQFIILISPPLLVLFFVNIINFKQAAISLPSNLFLVLGAFLGFLFYKSSSYIHIILLVLLLRAWFFFGEEFYFNKINYGSFKKEVNIKTPTYEFFDSSEKKILLKSSSKKIVLDFWNSSCAPCYRLFPYIDSISKIIDTSKYEIFVVNIPKQKEIFTDNFQLLNKFNYSFNQLFAKNISFLDSINTNTFPTTVIIENENIIYKGDFETAISKLNIK